MTGKNRKEDKGNSQTIRNKRVGVVPHQALALNGRSHVSTYDFALHAVS
jgi:hypothetical protein